MKSNSRIVIENGDAAVWFANLKVIMFGWRIISIVKSNSRIIIDNIPFGWRIIILSSSIIIQKEWVPLKLVLLGPKLPPSSLGHLGIVHSHLTK
jgi:hypothetical protein